MLFVFAYVDIFGFWRTDIIQGALAGEVPGAGAVISQTFLTLTTLYVLIPSLMVGFSLVAPTRFNRPTNSSSARCTPFPWSRSRLEKPGPTTFSAALSRSCSYWSLPEPPGSGRPALVYVRAPRSSNRPQSNPRTYSGPEPPDTPFFRCRAIHGNRQIHGNRHLAVPQSVHQRWWCWSQAWMGGAYGLAPAQPILRCPQDRTAARCRVTDRSAGRGCPGAVSEDFEELRWFDFPPLASCRAEAFMASTGFVERLAGALARTETPRSFPVRLGTGTAFPAPWCQGSPRRRTRRGIA